MKNILVHKINIILQIFSIVASMNLLASHTIRVGLTYESESGFRASGCALYQDASGNVDSNTMSCYLFDDDKCRIKTFSLEGVPKAPYINWTIPKNESNQDIQCGFNNVANSNAIYQRLSSNNVLSGASPKTPATFEYSNPMRRGICSTGSNYASDSILVNKNAGLYFNYVNGAASACDHHFIGDILTKLGSIGCNRDEDYVLCTFIYDSYCKQRKYAINGAAVSPAYDVPNCSLSNKSLASSIYNSFNIIKVGVNPTFPAVFKADELVASNGIRQAYNIYIQYSSNTTKILTKNPGLDPAVPINQFGTAFDMAPNYEYLKSIGKSLNMGRAAGCAQHPDNPGELYRCYALNDYDCYYVDVTKTGFVVNSIQSVPNCGYYNYIDETQVIYDSLTITRKGLAPDPIHTTTPYAIGSITSPNNYNSLFGIISFSFQPDKHYVLAAKSTSNQYIVLAAVQTQQAFTNTLPMFYKAHFDSLYVAKAAGCKQDSSDAKHYNCTVFYPNFCQTARFAKNGAIEPQGWQTDEQCGYDINPINALTLYNDLNKNDINNAVILFGNPPDVNRTVFNTIQHSDTKYYFTLDGVMDALTPSKLAIGCKPPHPDANSYLELECISFQFDRCVKFKYSAFGGIISDPQGDAQGRIYDTECGYNNPDIALKKWNEFDPNLRAGNPPSMQDANFTSYEALLYGTQIKQYNLKINDYAYGSELVNGYAGVSSDPLYPAASFGCRIISDPTQCTRVNSDGSTDILSECVECIGMHIATCYKQLFSRTGYPISQKKQDVSCAYSSLSEDTTSIQGLYDSLGPDTVNSPLYRVGNRPELASITAEQENDKYILKINGNKALEGDKGVACLNSLPSDKYLTCYKFDQLKCWWIEIWKSGYIKSGLNGGQSANCGYAYYGNSTTLDTILANIDSTKESRQDINQSALFKAIYDVNYIDTTNPPNAFRKYYINVDGLSDLAFVATRGIGCGPELQSQRECIAFDQFDCYKRKYAKTGLALDANWTIKQEKCGYAYKGTASALYDSLDPLVRAGEHPSTASADVKGKVKNILGIDKYIISIFGTDLDDGVFSKAVGCKSPGIDISPTDPEKDIKMECIGFNEGSTYRRIFYVGGLPATDWKAIQKVECDPALTNVVDCAYNSDFTKQEYCKVKDNSSLATSGDPADLSCP